MPTVVRPRWLRLFRIALATIAAGVVPFIVLEIGLRVFHYGYPTGFFVPIEGKDALSSNEKFGWRFFPSSIARVPVVSYLPAKKAADTYRIFVLGDSAAMGIPEPAFGFGQILRVLLASRYPGVKFEVINTAMTAINSHVLVPIAWDSARLNPDLFIVLSGNNEVVGPYGPGTVLAGYSPTLALIHANIWFKSTLTAQLLESGLASLRKPEAPQKWEGMAMFAGHQVAADDPRLATVYRNFHANLEDSVHAARRAGAAVILATVPVNLKDSAPFASLHKADLNSEDRARWQSLYDGGVQQARSGNCAAATSQFAQAETLDNRFADLHYRLGRCLLSLGQRDHARKELLQARDLDALRFRADTQINDAIRDVAAHDPQGVLLADAEKAFSPDVPGREFFFEHVHLNFSGNYLLARTMLPNVESAMRKQRSDAAMLSESEAAEALGYTEWDRDKSDMEMLTMMQEPPFTAQADYAERKDQLGRTLRDLREKWASPERLAAMRRHFAQYEAALQRNPGNVSLREILAELLSRSGDHPAAVTQYRTLIGLVPTVARWHANLGHELAEQGQLEDARAEAEVALHLDSQDAAARFTLGKISERTGQLADAVASYEANLRITPGNADAYLRLAIIMGKQGRYREAAERYTEYLRRAPGSAAAESNLGFILVKLGDVPNAIQHYREALRLNPNFPEAANNLGAALERFGQTTEAIFWYRAALRLRPDFPDAKRHLNEALAKPASRSR